HHWDLLEPRIRAFEQRDAHTFTVERDAVAGQYVFHVHGLEPLDPDWNLMVGDCIHNARAALDCLIAQLFGLVSGQRPEGIDRLQFPLVTEPERFASSMGISRARKERDFAIHLARIEELQPYNATNPSVWGDGPEGEILSTLPG